MLLDSGLTPMVQAVIGETITPFDNTNANLGVGDGTAVAAATQTDLQGTNKTRKAMDAGYPQRTGDSVDFRSTFGTAEANYAWEEWGVFNAATAGAMLNRKVEALGTKTSASSWQLTVTLVFSNP